MTEQFTRSPKLTLAWLLINTSIFALAVAGTCYKYQPAANLTKCVVVIWTIISISAAVGRKDPGQRFRMRNLRLPPRWADQSYDVVVAILFVAHGWFFIASCWILHTFMLVLVRSLQGRPVTATERGKAVLRFYWANTVGISQAEVLPYLLADLQISEGEAFTPALNKAYSYAATEEDS